MIRVSSVLAPHSPYKNINQLLLEHASARGTKVHDACSLIAKGLYMANMPEEVSGYAQSFQQWFDKEVINVIAIEPDLRDEALGFRGHPDFVIQVRDYSIALIDIKTPVTKHRIWNAQLAAYHHLVEIHYGKPFLTASLQLDKYGRYPKLNVLQDIEAHWWGFYHALETIKYFGGGEDDGE